MPWSLITNPFASFFVIVVVSGSVWFGGEKRTW
jgi:hypothetical protein